MRFLTWSFCVVVVVVLTWFVPSSCSPSRKLMACAFVTILPFLAKTSMFLLILVPLFVVFVDCAVVVGYYKSFDVVVVGHRAESKVVDHHIEVVLVVADALMHHETDREIGTAVVSEELAAGRIEVVRV